MVGNSAQIKDKTTSDKSVYNFSGFFVFFSIFVKNAPVKHSRPRSETHQSAILSPGLNLKKNPYCPQMPQPAPTSMTRL